VPDGQKRVIKVWLGLVRRTFKFVNGESMMDYNLVNDCLRYAGIILQPKSKPEVTYSMLGRRAVLVPAIYKLVTLALVEERSVVTKGVRKALEKGTDRGQQPNWAVELV